MRPAQILGVIVIIVSIALGLWLGGWVLFVGGIVDVVNAIQATPVSGVAIGLGLLKVVFASAVGTVSAVIGVSFGVALYEM